MNRTTDEKIKIRNHWFKIGLISIFSMVLMFKIAVTKFIFNFSDFLSIIVAVFAICISALFYSKVNEALQTAAKASKELLPFKKKTSAGETEVYEEEPKMDEQEAERRLLEQEDQLKRMTEVQNQIIDRLLTSSDLDHEDKRDYIEYLLEKENEAFLARQEIDRLSKVLHPEDEVHDAELNDNDVSLEEELGEEEAKTIKDIVQLLGKEFILQASFEQLNHKMREIQPSLSPEAEENLKENGYVDPYYNVTRKGLKEFRRAAKKFSYGTGVKFLSKVVQRGK